MLVEAGVLRAEVQVVVVLPVEPTNEASIGVAFFTLTRILTQLAEGVENETRDDVEEENPTPNKEGQVKDDT